MISKVKVYISVGGEKNLTHLLCDSKKVSITFFEADGVDKIYTGSNFYKCFASLRQDNPAVVFLCKGSKVNVHPSGMSAQMSLGLKAYELRLGVTPSLEDLVYIFDYDDKNLADEPRQQELFYRSWIESVRK
ncbi:hypothetical protein LOY67_24400 [Pseudomonas sp. B21-056]|jgi:hypothetical protein|uniref:hypothetical protein n=1 Tax=Pseudomonas sp. B21-056 TaxID=2895495 RepID=UPI00222F5B1F|nr:hypothetical protein [Pseudomonas sp. B21-056]UZE23111.1 hypothetical protein LOY67_24400 [Pseudomonas sp. B21-056]